MPIDFRTPRALDSAVIHNTGNEEKSGQLGILAGKPFRTPALSTGGGIVSDTAALRSAIQSAIGSQQDELKIPRGRYLIDADGLFSDLGSGVQLKTGFHFQGAGTRSTQLVLVTNGSPKWFYKNGATSRLQFASFSDMSFETDSIVNGNGFEITSAGHEQAFTFTRCSFQNFAKLFSIKGEVGGDSLKVLLSRINGVYVAVVELDNPQAVINEWFGTNIDGIYGDVYSVIRGGDLKVYGGSFSMFSQVADTTRHFILRVANNSGVSVGNATFMFYGIRPEMISQYAGLVHATGDAAFAFVKFVDSNFNRVTADVAQHEAVRIGNFKRVNFVRSNIPAKFNFYLDPDPATAPGANMNGSIEFENCLVPDTLYDQIIRTQIYGQASCRGGHILTTLTENTACDFDIGWDRPSYNNPAPRIKSYAIFNTQFGWPFNDTLERTILLPKNSVIRRVFLLKPVGGTAPAYRIRVGSNNKGTVYASSTTAAQAGIHTIDLANLAVEVGTDLNLRRLRVWSDDGSGGASGGTRVDGGYAIVEYW